MTSVFTNNGKNIPVSIIEVEPNVVTNVLTEEKHGYVALQLAAFDRRDKTSTKPLVGHLNKALTGAKYFIKEVRGMEGYKLGDKVDASIFAAGELIDVTGTSKGKGFQGNIKRHNQKIGPKSHGGGGGSQPTRQTGSLGDMVSNRVFKGMTMPGHMGHEQVTVQNLEVVAVDAANNYILVKGSIPGPNKGFVVVRQAVKGLPNHEAVELVNLREAAEKNELLEEAKKWGADVNTEMTLVEMTQAIKAAKEAHEAEQAAKEAEEAAAKAAAEAEKLEDKAEHAKEELDKIKNSGDEEAVAAAEQKLETLENQAHAAEEQAEEAKEEAKEAELEAQAAEEKAEALQVQDGEEK